MNEQQNVNNPGSKPRKKRSFWWLKLLLILILFAAGIIAGLTLSSHPIVNNILEDFFPQYSVQEPVSTPTVTVAPTEKPIEFKASPSPKPSKAPVEIVSPEAQKKAEEAQQQEQQAELSPMPEPAATPEVSAVPALAPADAGVTGNGQPAAQNEYIGIDAALDAALKHAKLEAADVFVYSVHRERDDGLVYYQVEFGFDGREYEYEVNAYTAEIESWKQDRSDFEDKIAEASGNELDLSSCISEEQAKAAAFEHAGYNEQAVKNLKTGLEINNNKLIYDVEFHAQGYEFEYKVDAASGQIIMVEKERN